MFGHHDLLPGNFMDDGQRLWLIDWEYGAFGTAMFDLANLSSNGEFDPSQDDALFDAYFAGRADAAVRHSFAAMKAASALREALWAMVSDVHLRTPGVDYKAHADSKSLYQALKARDQVPLFIGYVTVCIAISLVVYLFFLKNKSDTYLDREQGSAFLPVGK